MIAFDLFTSFLVNIEVKICQMLSWNTFETLNKINKIWLKWLNQRIDN